MTSNPIDTHKLKRANTELELTWNKNKNKIIIMHENKKFLLSNCNTFVIIFQLLYVIASLYALITKRVHKTRTFNPTDGNGKKVVSDINCAVPEATTANREPLISRSKRRRPLIRFTRRNRRCPRGGVSKGDGRRQTSLYKYTMGINLRRFSRRKFGRKVGEETENA